MLFITPATDATQAKDYFTRHMERSDYYLRDSQEMPGEWHGMGAELLGLSGTVDKQSYFRLCENINPVTREQLTPHNKGKRRVLYDFTFDAPKSVSLAYELGGDERVLDEFRAAVKDTMSEMEAAMMARVRSNKRDENRASSNMIWGEFIHRTARPVTDKNGISLPDPQLHCHAVAFNATFDTEENKWKAAEFSNLVRDKGYYQAAFHSRLAKRLSDLGYGIERDGNSFRLVGIDTETTEKFSRRSAIIDAEALRLGITDPADRRGLGRTTRESKSLEQMSISELRALWAERLSDDERNAIFKARFGQENTSPGPAAAMDYALTHSFERSSAVTEKELLKTALIHSVGAASVSDIKGELSRPTILRRSKNGITYATTKEVLAEEIATRDFVREGRGKHVKLGGYQTLTLDPELSAEQREAAEVILGSRDTVTALKGGAGTGKTRMLLTTAAAIKATGKEVHPFAPSADAASELQKEGFGEAATVERLLIDPEMQSKMRGQVLLIDEAGLLSVKDMKRLFDVAKQQEARLILVGDSAQHHGVTRGDALRLLEQDTGMKTATLKDIRRQTNDDYRAAVKAISEGDAPGADGATRLEDGLKKLDDMGAIIELPDDTRERRIAADYAEVIGTRKHGGGYKTALVISPTHKEGEKVSAAIRDELKAEGRIGDDERQFLSLRPLNLTEAERGDKRAYFGGEVVQFMQNGKDFKRGERVQVTGSDDKGVHITRADGSADMLPLNEAKKFAIYGKNKVALAAGDKLRVTMNGLLEREARRGVFGKKAKDRIDNGAIYQVEGFTKGGDIKLTNGFVIPKNYGGITHGYVVTSHASQGKTVDVSLVALGQESFSAANREQFYVSVSRGKEAVRLYTDDKAAMMDAVQDSAARLSATELMQSQPPKPKRNSSFMQRLIRTGFVQRAYTAVRERMAAYTWAVNHPNHSHGEGLSLEH
jgi:conjugative relaxase-like TrwC/TraI family protein